jgi:hypothetical protein
VKKDIFFSAGTVPSKVDLKGYAEMFSHIKEKTFSAFFFSDFMGPPSVSPLTSTERVGMVRELDEAAKELALDVYVFNPGLHNVKALIHRSRFADLILINPIPQLTLSSGLETIAQFFFEKLACPVLLTPHLPINYREVIIFFDSTMSELTALKTFITLFGHQVREIPVTVLMVNSLSKPELFLEHYFIQFVKKYFYNVGIVPMNGVDIPWELAKLACRSDNPFVITGKVAISLLNKKEIVRDLFNKQASLFYSND